MWRWFKAIDQILRGETTRVAALREGTIRLPAFGVAAATVILGLIYGFCMGWFALINRATPQYAQLLASTVKVPALFFLTLLVTFPSLYVFNALVGSRLVLAAMARLLMATLAVAMAVLASFGPITVFFSISTENYSFMVLLNVLLFAVAGFLGLAFLLQTLHRLSVALLPPGAAPSGLPPAPIAPNGGAPDPPAQCGPEGALESLEGQVLGRHVKLVFRCWVVIFALVGAQMSWVLRPFIGNPQQPFEWFRHRQSSFFEAVWGALMHLFR